MESNKKVFKMVLTAVMMALVFVGTKIIQIPTPTGGYIHIGDGFVFLSGIVLGPFYGAIAGGVGSMLTDLLSGYTQYAVITLILKGLASFIVAVVVRGEFKNNSINRFSKLVGCILGAFLIVVGYFAFEAYALGLGVEAALLGVYTNLIQVATGVFIATALSKAFSKVDAIREMIK